MSRTPSKRRGGHTDCNRLPRMALLDALIRRFTREEEPVDHDPALDGWVELWPPSSARDEQDVLVTLEQRVDSVRQRLECLDATDGQREAVASLAKRAAQSSAAIARCRREQFAPNLRACLRVKVSRLEAEVANLQGYAGGAFYAH